jgi:hypothetical protein
MGDFLTELFILFLVYLLVVPVVMRWGSSRMQSRRGSFGCAGITIAFALLICLVGVWASDGFDLTTLWLSSGMFVAFGPIAYSMYLRGKRLPPDGEPLERNVEEAKSGWQRIWGAFLEALSFMLPGRLGFSLSLRAGGVKGSPEEAMGREMIANADFALLIGLMLGLFCLWASAPFVVGAVKYVVWLLEPPVRWSAIVFGPLLLIFILIPARWLLKYAALYLSIAYMARKGPAEYQRWLSAKRAQAGDR